MLEYPLLSGIEVQNADNGKTHPKEKKSSSDKGVSVSTVQNTRMDKQATFVSCSAFLAGLVEVFCHTRYGCFVNMMTGNTIKFVSSLAKLKWKESLVALVLIASYMLARRGLYGTFPGDIS